MQLGKFLSRNCTFKEKRSATTQPFCISPLWFTAYDELKAKHSRRKRCYRKDQKCQNSSEMLHKYCRRALWFGPSSNTDSITKTPKSKSYSSSPFFWLGGCSDFYTGTIRLLQRRRIWGGLSGSPPIQKAKPLPYLLLFKFFEEVQPICPKEFTILGNWNTTQMKPYTSNSFNQIAVVRFLKSSKLCCGKIGSHKVLTVLLFNFSVKKSTPSVLNVRLRAEYIDK